MNFYKTRIDKIGDPFVLEYDNKYYIYATSAPDGFLVWTSNDMKTFSLPEKCYQKSEHSFGKANFWAPEVRYHHNKFVMHYTTLDKTTNELKIGVAISELPQGPFIDVNDQKPMFDLGYAVLDGHVFIDEDGKKYFYFVKDCQTNIVNGNKTNQIYVAQLNEDLTALISKETLVLTPTEHYEIVGSVMNGYRYLVNEGPFIIKRNGIYYLMFSCNFFDDPAYAICVATSKKPTKGFKKYKDPVLKQLKGVFCGPGHNSICHIDGLLYAVFHIHTDMLHPSGDRTIAYSKITFLDDKLLIEL